MFVLAVVQLVPAQQTTGTPGSPSATTTIDGKQLPAPDPKFGGVIKDDALQSQPWWAPRIVPPNGAPNVLLIITDDGRVANWLLGANSGVEKEYSVKVREKLRAGVTTIFARGMSTEPFGKLLPAEAKILTPHLLSVILHEGKKHQIRVMLAELGYTIEKLKRLRVGEIKLGDLRPGETRKLKQKELSNSSASKNG